MRSAVLSRGNVDENGELRKSSSLDEVGEPGVAATHTTVEKSMAYIWSPRDNLR